jgi:hypothetical protein
MSSFQISRPRNIFTAFCVLYYTFVGKARALEVCSDLDGLLGQLPLNVVDQDLQHKNVETHFNLSKPRKTMVPGVHIKKTLKNSMVIGHAVNL